MSNTKREQKVIDALKSQFGDKILEAKLVGPRRIDVKVADPVQLEVFSFAKEKYNAWHLIAMSGVDTPDEVITCVYHFDIIPPHNGETAVTINLQVDCDNRDKPQLTTISEIIPGALFFERETHDLMGIHFEGHPDLSKLVLPEDFPDGVHPLRKDFLLEIQKEEAAKKANK